MNQSYIHIPATQMTPRRLLWQKLLQPSGDDAFPVFTQETKSGLDNLTSHILLTTAFSNYTYILAFCETGTITPGTYLLFLEHKERT